MFPSISQVICFAIEIRTAALCSELGDLASLNFQYTSLNGAHFCLFCKHLANQFMQKWQSLCINQGFRQFCKVADIFPKAVDVTFFAVRLARAEDTSYLGEMFKIENSETLFPAFLETKNQFPRQG